jgi:oligopeptide/dipeptide ABC transporter ATP-binding protein
MSEREAGPVLEVRDLVKHYPVPGGLLRRSTGAVKAVDGVSLRLDRGRTLGLVGESGSGKSTLARVLVGIEKPTSGEVLVDGADVTRLSRAGRKQLRRDVQMVFQDPYTSLNPRMPVSEIVGEPFAIHGIDPAGGRRAAVGELLELVGLDPEHANRYPHQFSGGQRQRVGIARALALRPKILVCDEPVSALDRAVQAQILALLARLQRERGLALVFISHDLAVVRQLCQRVIVMYLGRVMEQAPAAELFARPRHPYTRALLASVPGADAQPPLEGELPSPSDPPSGCVFRTRCPMADELCARETPHLRKVGEASYAACHFVQDPATGGAAAVLKEGTVGRKRAVRPQPATP